MPSGPDLTPTPNWMGLRREAAFGETACARPFEVRRRRVFPTAIGLYGSSWSGVAFLMDANSRAPQKKGATLHGKDPEDRALTKVCRALRHLIDLEETLEEMASFRCSGRRPEGPGAEPGLKEAMERERRSVNPLQSQTTRGLVRKVHPARAALN